LDVVAVRARAHSTRDFVTALTAAASTLKHCRGARCVSTNDLTLLIASSSVGLGSQPRSPACQDAKTHLC
jgi:hypothetical protein